MAQVVLERFCNTSYMLEYKRLSKKNGAFIYLLLSLKLDKKRL